MKISAQPELEELLQIARDKSSAGRQRLTELVGDLFLDRHQNVGDRERSLMIEILRKLVHDVEIHVRKALAERFATSADSPPELVRDLANDEIEVAYPILIASSVLQDADLVEIVRERTLEHQLAIAMRTEISDTVSDALIATGETDVVKTLIENQNAQISERAMAYLVEESKRIDVYQEPLLRRQDMPKELAQRMYWWVSAALRQHIVARFRFDPTTVDEHVQETIHRVLGEGHGDATPIRKAAERALRLKETRSITPQLLVQTLRQGEVALFVDLFAVLTELRATLVNRIPYEPGGEGLAIGCRAVGISKAEFASLFLLSRKARPGEKIVDPAELSTVLGFFDQLKPETAQKVLRHWRLDPDYLYALKRLNERRGAGTTTDEVH